MIKKSYQTPILFAATIWIIINSQDLKANLTEECMLVAQTYTKPITKDNSNNLPVHIIAKDVISKYPHFIKYRGNVNIRQDNQTITADKVELTQTKIKSKNLVRTVIATGNIYYNDPQIILKGQRAWVNLNNKDTDIEKGNYLMVGRQGRGYANKVKLRSENRYTILEKGMFTTCPPGNDTWSVLGSKIILDRKEEIAKIWDARFRISNMSVFYTPYLQLPIGNKRHSGFLLPNASYSKDSGLYFSFPFYWNIAPNYQASIIPELFTFRGIKLNNEFHYLTIYGAGSIAINWAKYNRNYIKDKDTAKYHSYDNDDRWLLHWWHTSVFNQVWRFNIDYTKVSDLKYFTDFTSKYGNSTDGYTIQKSSITYTQPNWNTILTHKKFQVFLDSPNGKVYKIEPQLDLNYYKNNFWRFNLKTYVQAARITSIEGNNPNVTRLHIEPEVNLPLSNNLAKIKNTIKVMATYYNQKIPANLSNRNLKKRVIRILPKLISDAKLIFERDLLINSNYVQTLEPRIQYLYVPYHNQSNINNYDSSLLQVDYNGLFCNRIYSGLDRISSANQLTTGITTRIYDEKLTERFNLSIGQIYHFEDPRIENSNLSIKNRNSIGSLLWAGNIYLLLTDNLGLRGGLQYNRRLNNITTANMITEYRLDSDYLVQLNYRFVNRDYIKEILKEAVQTFQKGISQIGAVINLHLANHYSFVASCYYDLKENQPVNQLIGLQYNTCCWSINIGYERKIIEWQEKNFNSDYYNRWSINVKLNGLK